MAVRVPLPSAPFLFPDPLTTGIAPLPAIDRRRGQDKGMLFVVERNAFADDLATVVDGLGYRQYFEITRGKIAKQIEIVHLLIDKEKGVFGIVDRSGGPNAHACFVGRLLAANGAGGAARSTESSKISDGVAERRLSPRQTDDRKKQSRDY